MTSCWAPGAPVELSHSSNPARKLPWTLERVDMGAGWVGVNTSRVNDVVAEAVLAGRIEALGGYRELGREVVCQHPHHPRSRLDMLLQGGERPDALVEIKNVTLLEGDCLYFPDAVSARARKHLDFLLDAVRQGRRGIVVFAINRPEGSCFRPAEQIDPQYAERLREVVRQGVEVIALRIHHTHDGLNAGKLVPVGE